MKTSSLGFAESAASGKRAPRCWLAGLAALAAALTLAGCQPQRPPAEKTAAPVDLAGTYTLVSVDNQAVPCTLTHDGAALTVKSGTFQISADGTCVSVIQFTAPTGRDVQREVKATYTRQGTKLTMKWEGAGMTEGTVDGTTFTMNNEGSVFAYRKQ